MPNNLINQIMGLAPSSHSLHNWIPGSRRAPTAALRAIATTVSLGGLLTACGGGGDGGGSAPAPTPAPPADTRLTQVTPDQVLRWSGENQQRTAIADLTPASDGGLWVLGADDGLFARPFLRKVGGAANCGAESLRYLSELSSRFERRQGPTSMTTAKNGSFYVAFMGVGRVYVARFSEATCAVDETVGDRGVFTFAVPGLRTVTDIRIHRDAQDRVLVAVAIPGELLLRRLNADGSWDAAFGNAGLATNPNSDSFWMSQVTSAADGSIYVSGAVSIPFAFQPAILKMDATGRPVASFGTAGVQRYPEPSLGTGSVGQLLVESNRIVAAMATGQGVAVDSIVTNDSVVAAIDPVSGRLLPSFGQGGFLRWDWGYSNSEVTGHWLPNGRGGYTGCGHVIKSFVAGQAGTRVDITATGQVDPSVPHQGRRLIADTNSASCAGQVQLGDGRLAIALNDGGQAVLAFFNRP